MSSFVRSFMRSCTWLNLRGPLWSALNFAFQHTQVEHVLAPSKTDFKLGDPSAFFGLLLQGHTAFGWACSSVTGVSLLLAKYFETSWDGGNRTKFRCVTRVTLLKFFSSVSRRERGVFENARCPSANGMRQFCGFRQHAASIDSCHEHKTQHSPLPQETFFTPIPLHTQGE